MLSVVGTVAFDTLALVRGLAQAEHTSSIHRLHLDMPGGTAGNAAMALARLGAPPRLVAAVGPDFAGSHAERALMDAGIDLDGLLRTGTPTARAYVFFDGEGAQCTYFSPGAGAELARARAPTGRVHFCAGEIACYPDMMRKADWVSFDPGQELFHRDVGDILACLEHVDVLFVNRHELDVLQKRGGLDLPDLLAKGIGVVVETRGGEGTLVHTANGRFAAPAVPATVRDPTGAGDAHRAGFLYALERGAELGSAARLANVLGSFAVEHVGAQEGHPTLQQALARYREAFHGSPF